MKSYFFAIIAIITFSLALVSCQREVDWSTNNPTTADSSYLIRAYAFDTTLGPGTDTLQWLSFQYDAQKRLTTMFSRFKTVGSPEDTTIFTFSYQGNDTLPYKYVYEEKYHFGPVRNHRQTTVFNLYLNGFISQDSSIFIDMISGINSGAEVNKFQVSGGTVNRYESNYDFIGGNYVLNSRDTGVYTVTQTLGNITSQTLVSGNGAYESAQVTYDNKFNPLGKIIKLRYPVFESTYFEVWSTQLSNAQQVQFKEPFNPIYQDTYTYQYRADGYPVSHTYSTNAGTASYNKAKYFYTTL
ncbi:MAG TPA: hypothetical protein PLZ10_02865 [Chitinophagaceae bacterium]|nr:hypothetical protein [Chitinophagaceae bacterium]